jgi:hypothetical protein
MITISKFWKIVPNKGIAIDKNTLIDELEETIKIIKEIKEKIPEDIKKNDVERIHKDILNYLSTLKLEKKELVRIEQEAASEIKNLSDLTDKEKDLVLKVQLRLNDIEVSHELDELEDIENKIHSLILKARSEAQRIHNWGGLKKYTALINLYHLLEQIKKKQFRIAQEVKEEKKHLADTEKDLKRLEHAKTKKEEEKVKEDLVKAVEHFYRHAIREAKDISVIEHDDVILTFNIAHELRSIYNLLINLRRMGYPTKEGHDLLLVYYRLRTELDYSLRELTTMRTYLERNI